MAITRKRKHTSTEDVAPSRLQTSITAFGTISKAQAPHVDVKKQKTSHDEVLKDVDKNTVQSRARSEHKRKRSIASDSDQEHNGCEAFAQSRPFKQFVKRRDSVTTPEAKRFKDVVPPSPSETPSKRAIAMLNRLNLDKTRSIPLDIQSKVPAWNDASSLTLAADAPLPAELQHLEQLYAAFVSALSLCYAHGGASTSTELQTLLPAVTKQWKKRAVDLEDLRRLLSFDKDNFVLEYCGQAGVRLVTLPSRGRQLLRGGSLIDAEGLKANFRMALKQTWCSWAETQTAVSREPIRFLEQVQLAEVRKNEAAQAAMPFLKRGQRRLADLRASQASTVATADDKLKSSQVDAQGRTTAAIQNRGSSLLDRVLAKQAANANLPAGPNAEQQQRNAALHRIEDVTRVLNLLAGNKLRASFSMQSITQHLQQSLRNPISRDEVERCLRLMSLEITPGFVHVMQTGAVQSVVVNRTGRVGLEELRKRVGDAVLASNV